MALQGTIKDFALPDIFQLIGIQRKTGVLTLDNGEHTVTLKFLEGQVVGADTKTETIEERLGELLVRTGRITDVQLKEALREQKNTLQRLGHILVRAGNISEDDLVEALRLQSSQIIYRLFRWHDGTYHFDRVEDLEYDQKHFVPISSETILMEGARMIDEWPIIERRIKSPKMVLRRSEAADALDLNVDSILNEDIDFELDLDHAFDPTKNKQPAPEQPQKITLSREEREIMSYVDGKRSVQEISDLLTLGEFDTHRILSDMLTRNLVEEVPTTAAETARSESREFLPRLAGWLAHAVVVIVVLFSLGTMKGNPLTPWTLLSRDPTSDLLRLYASMAQLESIERSIQVFYLTSGVFPESLDVLAKNGCLAPGDLLDPWGRPYEFQYSSGGFRISGHDAKGQADPALALSRRFNTVQQAMHSPDGADLH